MPITQTIDGLNPQNPLTGPGSLVNNGTKDLNVKPFDSSKHRLSPPIVVAVATDKYLTPLFPFADKDNLPDKFTPKYGQDITSRIGKHSKQKHSVGNKPSELKQKMRKLLSIFASGDKTGMAQRLFSQFLSRQTSVNYFDDDALNSAASKHEHIKEFCSRALSAPPSPQKSSGKTRIHQALKNANWDITQLTAPTDLGVPAFNNGSKALSSGDFDNGLGVMINGVQHVYILATHYHYDKEAHKYFITLKYIFYDVFGLDDDDLREFGATSDSIFSSKAAIGITAWWQLQHQFNYSPLVTRIIIEETHEVPTK